MPRVKTKHFAFILTMPNINTWNNRWSGEGKLFAKVFSSNSQISITLYECILGHHSYNFGDGWRASIEVKEVDAKEKRKLVNGSSGFMVYDWMITSLLKHGYITTGG